MCGFARVLASFIAVVMMIQPSIAVAGEETECHADLRSELGLFFASDVVVVDEVVYVISWFDGLMSFDIGVSIQPSPLDMVSLGDDISSAMVYNDGVVYCLTFEYDLVVVDVSDPANMSVLTVYEIPDMGDRSFSSTPALAIQGDTLFAPTATTSTSTHLLNLIDISNPASPALITQFDGGSAVLHWGDLIDVEGNAAYISGIPQSPGDPDPWGVFVLDITDPMSIGLAGSFGSGTAPIRAMEARGDHLYLNTGELVVLDVSMPANPFQTASLAVLGDKGGLAIDGDFIFVMDSYIDISTPGAPTTVFHQATLSGATENSDLVGTEAYSLKRGVLEIVNFDDCSGGCLADYNEDGSQDFLDISTYLSSYYQQSPLADLNVDGAFDFVDLSLFIDRYSLGCTSSP